VALIFGDFTQVIKRGLQNLFALKVLKSDFELPNIEPLVLVEVMYIKSFRDILLFFKKGFHLFTAIRLLLDLLNLLTHIV